MDAVTARDTIIKPKLAEVFGNAIATSLVLGSTAAALKGSTEQERLKLMVEAICSDPRVGAMWGAAQVQRQKTEWLGLGG